MAGGIHYRRGREEPTTLAVLQGLVRNAVDGWRFTLDALRRFFETALTVSQEAPPLPSGPMASWSEQEIPAAATQSIGAYLAHANLLGQRTAELHLALSADKERPDLAPEPFSTLYQRALYQSLRAGGSRSFALLRERSASLPVELHADAAALASAEKVFQARLQPLVGRKIAAMRIRCHGDYHLGQVLYAHGDFVIMDFEGEPGRSLRERRLKRSPLRDVASMLRSFHYVAANALRTELHRPVDARSLVPWANAWTAWVSREFLRAYYEHVAGLLPAKGDVALLLDAYLLEKAAYELEYELNNRPDWVSIPIAGLRSLLGLA